DERFLADGNVRTADIVRDGENTAEVVGRMAPLGGKPRVIEVEPTDHTADVPRRLHRIEFELCPRHSRAIAYRRSGDDRPEMFAALGEALCEKAATQRIDQAVSSSVVGLVAIDPISRHVVGDVDELLVGIRSNVEVYVGTHLYQVLLFPI